ncbi:fibronectin type III domain-containing protein 7 [Esox lucius]|uniref:Fibronectin type-III domain-containing protein n=1 Tax=Esox lucius TaxID=8010 RepID=A0A3P8Y2T8_ESOLU|nr:fibronectin type III domain-containing protein 7 [Esox lucius]
MGSIYLKVLTVVLSFSLSEISAMQNDITISVFQVTSKSMTVRWSHYSGASSYKISASPINSLGPSVFAQFSGNTVMGSVNTLSPNTVYSLQVEAMDTLGNVLSSAALEKSSAPPVPTVNQAYSKQSNSMTVEFSEVSGASSYIVRAESPVGDFFSETPVPSSPGTVLQLSPYSDYRLSVMSVSSPGRSQPSPAVLSKTVVGSPGLKSTSPSNDTIVLTWSPVQHAVLYSLGVVRQGSSSVLTLNTTEPFVTFNNLEPGTTYCIKGVAWTLDGRYGDDLTVCQITRPPSPESIQVSVTQGRSVGLTVYWQTVQGADDYLVRASSGQNCSASASYCIISPLLCGQNHSVNVTAQNSAGPSNPSDPEEFITFPCPPDRTWIEEPEAGSCVVRWAETSLVEFYTAFIKRDDGVEEFCNTTDTSCHFQCLCGYAYLSTVFAYNEAGSSPPGDLLNYTTIPCCPENVTIDLISTETLEITWSSVRGVDFYETMAVETDSVVQCKDTAPVCVLSDLRCNSQYRTVVTPCSEMGGCNRTCTALTHETDPCSPEILSVSQTNSSTSVSVLYTAPNTPNTTYTVTAVGLADTHTCQSNTTSCQLTQLPCGATYDVTAYASTAVGRSLPSYSVPLETGPCCPTYLTVNQVTQAMTNVTWSPATGAGSYITSLISSRGHARCHTMDTHCLMGCITCETSYSVSLEAISRTGHKSECSYHGFSSSACCPSSVKLYRMANSSVRIYWRSSGPQNYTVDLIGTGSNYTCEPTPLSRFCDIADVMCGDIYTVVVAPVGQDGTKVNFCHQRVYSVSCSGNNVGLVVYRGKRSVT